LQIPMMTFPSSTNFTSSSRKRLPVSATFLVFPFHPPPPLAPTPGRHRVEKTPWKIDEAVPVDHPGRLDDSSMRTSSARSPP
jgi:hypothetical protein